MLIHAMILIALVDFFALKYRQANKSLRFKVESLKLAVSIPQRKGAFLHLFF